MARDETKKAWDRFEADVKGLAGDLRRHYRGAGDDKQRAELNRSLEQLRQAAESVFNSFETATRDPEVRSRSKQAARSFGSALAETFRDLGDEVDKVIRKTKSDTRK
ncbi:MAG: hypothetical protein M3R21_03775 [Candidatus Dormibacteraeota bacterium]|nr:hypothetical protein [Candidatus Dormibacteraeota bacterium]